jgi:hypothetical protein
MCDERTASKMTAWSTAKRNGLSADNIINMRILEKYWKYGFSTSTVYTQTARLCLDNFDTTTSPPTRTLPAPTLQDLPNPVPLAPNLSEADLFNNAEPYGQGALERDEEDEESEEGNDDDVDMEVTTPHVIRSSTAGRLAIEQFVNLETTVLLARLDFNKPRYI